MYKSMTKIIAFVLVLLMVIPYPVYAAAVGKFTSVVGKVSLTRAGTELRPVVNSYVEAKDIIVTGDNSSAKMVFSDDSTITIAQNSKMEVKEFAVQGKTRKGIFSVAVGKIIANVSKFVGGNNTFQVNSSTAVCGVRGTGFEFTVDLVGTQAATTVTCTSGSLTVSALSSTGAVISTITITAGQTVIITSTGITFAAAGTVASGGTAVSTSTGTGMVTSGAAGAGSAGGAAAAGGIGVGTISFTTAAFAVGVAAAVATSGSTAPAHHGTPAHH